MILRKTVEGEDWVVVYDKATRPDGSLLFPEKLTREFLDKQRKLMGSYIFANQYQNEIIPEGEQDFKRSWLRYYNYDPEIKYTFAFVDPAISLEESACYTAMVVVDVDPDGVWWLKRADKLRITATQTVDLIFKVQEAYNCNAIGVENVAYQEALLHFCAEEMRRRQVTIPLVGVKRSPDKSKSMRIRSLVPRFEWERIWVKGGLHDFEDEYLKFPRGQFVDILDALASIEDIVFYPTNERKDSHATNWDREKHFIEQKARELQQDFNNR